MSKFAATAPDPKAPRKDRLSLLAKAPSDQVVALWSSWLNGAMEPPHDILRGPEVGAIMVRGRAGAIGAPFNLGEMTVTRCTVRLASGAVGHGYVQGRSAQAARIAALIDALCEDGQADMLETAVFGPLRDDAEAVKAARAAKAAATKVEFFTMVRGG
ncbi:MAG: phosphonate C-P lyase system protein PhnG [Pseudomonadota bacterium]